MKFTVLVKMLIMLLAGKTVTATQIASRFEISRRTAYRYIDELSIAGVPITVAHGPGGGFKIADSYRLPALFFTENEFRTLSSILNSLKEQLKGASEISSVLEKLTAARRDSVEIKLNASSLIIDGTGWSEDDKLIEKLSVISAAVENGTLIKIGYRDGNGNFSERLIEPHAVALKSGRWYVYAFCRMRDDFRLFKINRIEYADGAGTFLKRPFDFHAKPIAEWESAGEPINVTLSVAPEVRLEVEEWLGVNNVYTVGEKIFAEASLPYNNNLVSEIMRFGKNVTVLEPKILKNAVVNCAKEIVGSYENDE